MPEFSTSHIVIILIVFFLSIITSLTTAIIYNKIKYENNKTKNKIISINEKLNWLKEHYLMLNRIIKIFWFIIILIITIILVLNNYGAEHNINFLNIERNDILFLLLIALMIFPLLSNVKFKTPFGDVETGIDISHETKQQTEVKGKQYNNEIAKKIKQQKEESFNNQINNTTGSDNNKSISNEILQEEKKEKINEIKELMKTTFSNDRNKEDD